MAEEALGSTGPKANFHRLTRLLMRGGVNLFRETFDSIHSPADLPLRLADPAIQVQLRGARLTQPERAFLYPSPGMYGKSNDFDITLIFKLLRTICNLTPPPGPRGWDDLPNGSDHTLVADLVRIKYYRNEIHGHRHSMEISDTEFLRLWKEISEALLRIAANISPAKRDEWKKCIDDLLGKPLTPDEEICIKELETWYMQDLETKNEVVQLKEKVEFLTTLVLDIQTSLLERNQAAGSEPFLPEPGQAVGADDPVPNNPFVPKPEQAAGADNPEPNNPPDIDAWTVILSFKESVDLFFQYLRVTLNLLVRKDEVGSWHITVACSSLQVHEGLWEDYRSGHLSSVAQEMLITQQVLEKLGLTELKLRTFISEDQYERGKKLLEASSGAVDESEIQSAVQATITKAISEGSIEPDLLARISTLERENVELKEKVKAIEERFQSERASLERISKIEQENIELRRLVEANQESRRLKEKDYDERMLSLQMRSLDTEASFSQVLFVLCEEYGVLPPLRRRRSLGRRPTLTLGAFEYLTGWHFLSGDGLCQIIINRTTQEELVGEMDEIVRVFKMLDYHVDKATCTPSDGIEKVVESIAARDYQIEYTKIFVCFILSNLTENMEIESVKGGAFNVKDLMGMFSPLHCPQLSGRPKVFIFLVHQKAGIKASESKYSVSKTLTAHLPFHGLCLFVPYSQGYLSTLLTKIRLEGSDLDLLTILEEAKKSFYKETNITIPDPVHNFNERVFLA